MAFNDTTAPPRTVVDLSGVPFMDSSGVNVLLTFYRATHGTQGWLRIAGARPPVLRLLQVLGIDAVIACRPTLEQALTSYNPAPRTPATQDHHFLPARPPVTSRKRWLPARSGVGKQPRRVLRAHTLGGLATRRPRLRTDLGQRDRGHGRRPTHRLLKTRPQLPLLRTAPGLVTPMTGLLQHGPAVPEHDGPFDGVPEHLLAPLQG
ncbi:STAS domain-containing protein [Streptomyces griseomycini]|uniref:STAS domain-containing protein n=1 Tax=Streptomyces griseomycini TaxID=66895 RepID=UPI0027E417DB|nr:STAS domain-containing protein [Streptomyces griseomycini]